MTLSTVHIVFKDASCNTNLYAVFGGIQTLASPRALRMTGLAFGVEPVESV